MENKLQLHNIVQIAYRGQQIPGRRFPHGFTCLEGQGTIPETGTQLAPNRCVPLQDRKNYNIIKNIQYEVI